MQLTVKAKVRSRICSVAVKRLGVPFCRLQGYEFYPIISFVYYLKELRDPMCCLLEASFLRFPLECTDDLHNNNCCLFVVPTDPSNYKCFLSPRPRAAPPLMLSHFQLKILKALRSKFMTNRVQ